MKRSKAALLLLLALALTVPAARAQTTASSLRGVVKDESGPVADATIEAAGKESGFKYTATSGKDGSFSLPGVRPGSEKLPSLPLVAVYLKPLSLPAASIVASATGPDSSFTTPRRDDAVVCARAAGTVSARASRSRSAALLRFIPSSLDLHGVGKRWRRRSRGPRAWWEGSRAGAPGPRRAPWPGPAAARRGLPARRWRGVRW